MVYTERHGKKKERRQVMRNSSKPFRIHRRHEFFNHLTVCGAGANGMRIGNPVKAKYPCRMCGEGAKIKI